MLALRFCATMSQSRTSAPPPPHAPAAFLSTCASSAHASRLRCFFVVFLVARTSDSSRNRGEALTFTHARNCEHMSVVEWSVLRGKIYIRKFRFEAAFTVCASAYSPVDRQHEHNNTKTSSIRAHFCRVRNILTMRARFVKCCKYIHNDVKERAAARPRQQVDSRGRLRAYTRAYTHAWDAAIADCVTGARTHALVASLCCGTQET